MPDTKIDSAEEAENPAAEASDPEADPAEAETEADIDADGEASGDAAAKKTPPKVRRKLPKFLLPAILIPILLLLLLLGGAAMYLSAPIETEIGSEAKIPAMEAIPLLSVVCSVDTDLAAIDTGVLGGHDIAMTYCGFIPLRTRLTVQDTTPPAVETRVLYISSGYSPEPADFLVSLSDATDVTLTFAAKPDTSKDGTVTLRAADEGGNVTEADARFVIDPELSDCIFELGITADEMEAALRTLRDFDELSLAGIDLSVCGEYGLRTRYDSRTCLFTVTVRDTVAPIATAKSYDMLLGQTLNAEDFLLDIRDEDTVTAAFIDAPDFTKLGRQTFETRLTDASGNESTYTHNLLIHNVQSKLTLEVGTTTAEYLASVQSMLGTNTALPRLADDFQPDLLGVGSYKTTLIGEYSTIPLEIVIEDTVAPRITMTDVTVYTGDKPAAMDFVSACEDNSPVTFTFETTISTDSEGSFPVTIAATDAGGNRTTGTATLTVSINRVPPVIYGVKNISVYEGETVSYRSGVYAEDDRDGTVSVKIDASKVKTSKAGTYYVTYTAVDSDGNIGTATATVTVKTITNYAAYQLADMVLADIIESWMSDRQKAAAIYDWCVANVKYSTSTSYLMGNFAKAAYNGFRVHYGNCYTYYAMASALLTRAGISNIEIQRNDPENPHYWNLVNIDGNWYHLDTCPQPSPHSLKVCLLTDKELSAFTKPGYYSFDSSKYPATP